MLGKLYLAFEKAGASEADAVAAEEVAEFQTHISEIKSDLKLIKWMVGLVIVVEAIPYLRAIVT